MKKIVFILLIFCGFLVVWGCNKNKTYQDKGIKTYPCKGIKKCV